MLSLCCILSGQPASECIHDRRRLVYGDKINFVRYRQVIRTRNCVEAWVVICLMARKLIDRRFVVSEVEEYIFLADQQHPGS